jgi:NADP-dependent 3-hydroxy acid dehydrogenase YdfG
VSEKEQICFVTGATSGIGRAIVLALSEPGTTFGLAGRDLERLSAISREARARSARVLEYRLDLCCEDDIHRAVSDFGERFEGVDVLILSAGAFRMGPIAGAPILDLDLLYRTNVRGPYALTQAFLPKLIARRGQVVFINSSVGLTARAGVGAYAASKHASKAIADSLRAEVNGLGVRVISIYPGRTATPQQEKIHEQEGRPYQPDRLMQPEDIAKVVLNALSMPATAEVTDIQIRPMLKS